MNAEMGRAAFRLAMWIVCPALVLLLFLTPGTAEHSITVLTLGIGLLFMGVVTVLVRRSLR